MNLEPRKIRDHAPNLRHFFFDPLAAVCHDLPLQLSAGDQMAFGFKSHVHPVASVEGLYNRINFDFVKILEHPVRSAIEACPAHFRHLAVPI